MKARMQFNYAERWRIAHSVKERAAQKRLRSILLNSLIAVLALGLLTLPWAWQYVLEHKLEKVENQIVYYHEVEVALNDIDRLEGKLSRMSNFLKMTEGNSKNPREVISKIRNLLPEGANITTFALQADNSLQLGVILTGPTDLAKLWINFRDSGLFDDFNLDTVSLRDEVNRLDLTLKLK